jgi:flagellar capping protein FliD
MRVSGGFNNSNIFALFNTFSQGKAALHANRLSNSFFPINNAQGKGAFGSNALQYINEIKTAAGGLSNAVNDLSRSAFSQRTMVSSNTDVMTVNYTGNINSSNMRDMTVRVDQTAAGQLNEGARLGTTAAYEGSSSTNRFNVNVGGKTTQLSINVAAGESNRSVQEKMANAINSAGLGLRATVEVDSVTSTSMLRVESTTTGSDPKNSFTISDVNSDLVARTGIGEVSREGRDAIFSVDGGPARTSQSNTVNLGNGLSATFKAASTQEVRITRGQDMDYAKNAVRDMVQSYNSLFSAAAQNTGDPKAQGLASRMLNITSAYSGSLTSIGIGIDSSGRMTIDSKRLDQASENGSLQRFFTENAGRNFGFSAQLGRLADNVSRNTSNFVSSSMFGSSLGENFTYSGFGNLNQFNAINSGSIFDFMF